MALEGFNAWRIISTSTYEDITLQFIRNNSGLYNINIIFMLVSFNVPFTVPDVYEVINLQNGSTVPPNCFILFRREVQSRVSSTGLRIGRGALSRLLSAIWNDLRVNDPNLVNSFRNVANNVARMFNERLRIRIVNGFE
ncbi:1613_t:CDS:1 [Racocetra persica]|uniref:1613_t:CDS:1 n=1 Tax=Racocetra persica TaxID=160502 RepID=A0ACA9Q032_9GLOM|nr:1613_t:CDS:1 [Racocetra persica]